MSNILPVSFRPDRRFPSRCRSYESLELLAGNVSFPDSAGALLAPVLSRLPEGGQTKVRARIEEALAAVARGLRSNAGVAPPALLAFVHSTVADGLRMEQRAAEWAAATPGVGVRRITRPPASYPRIALSAQPRDE